MNKDFDVPNYRPQNKIKDIMEVLGDPNYFMEFLKEELEKKIVGEKDSIETLFTCFMGSKVKNAQKTSFNLLVNDKSGVGKDHITKNLLRVFPKQMREKRTRISPTALSYWHNAKFEPEWSWDGKILYLEDPSNSVLNCPPLKVMGSSDEVKETTITIKPGVTRDYIVNGKPVMVVTMARSNPIDEIKRRFNILNLDSGIDQTKAIMKRHTEYAKEGKTSIIDPILTDCIAYLKKYPVKLTFLEEKETEKVVDMFPKTINMRTQLNRFYDYVKAGTIISQQNREKIKEFNSKKEWLIAESDDWNNAIEPFMKTITNPLMITLTKDEQRLLDIIKNLGDEFHFVDEIDEKITFLSKRWLYKILKNMAENGFLDQTRMLKSETNRKAFAYKYVKQNEIKIKKW